MSKNPELKRISLMIREDQYQLISKKDLNLSGLLRDLLDDYFSEHTITLSVEEDTKEIYEMIAETGKHLLVLIVIGMAVGIVLRVCGMPL